MVLRRLQASASVAVGGSISAITVRFAQRWLCLWVGDPYGEGRLVFTSSLLSRLAESNPPRLGSENSGLPVAQALRMAYSRAMSDRPNEYVFKNEITNQLFLSRHNPDRSGLLTEFRIGTARLDVVIANGTTTCYEIKTDRDELRRLPAQLAAASKVFDKIYVVTTPRYLSAALTLCTSTPHVGAYVLNANNKLVRVKRAAVNHPNISQGMIFDCLRQSEYIPAIRRRIGKLPVLPNTRIYSFCKSVFQEFTALETHSILLNALRRRSCRKGDQLDHAIVPYEARALYFDADPRRRQEFARSALYEQLI
jgi:hypothetical protein